MSVLSDERVSWFHEHLGFIAADTNGGKLATVFGRPVNLENMFPLAECYVKKTTVIFLYFLANSGDFYRLLLAFANSLDPDRDRHNVGPDLDPDIRHSDIFADYYYYYYYYYYYLYKS